MANDQPRDGNARPVHRRIVLSVAASIGVEALVNRRARAWNKAGAAAAIARAWIDAQGVAGAIRNARLCARAAISVF
jgi:hypothetical protein